MPPRVHDHARIQALAIGAGAAAARRHRHPGKGGLIHHLQQRHHVGGIHGRHHQIRRDAVDGIVGGHRLAQRAVAADIAPEPGPGQRRFQIRDLRLRHVRNFGIVLHLATSGWWTLLISAAFCHKIRIT